MIISLIAAMSENRVIGKDNKLPWNLPEEMAHFKKTTLDKPIIMGRKTFDSLGHKPLPRRHNIILTSASFPPIPNVSFVHSVEEALKSAGDCEEVMVIGGQAIYEIFLPIAARIYLSVVHCEVSGDAFFPEINTAEWEITETIEKPEFTVQVFSRKDVH